MFRWNEDMIRFLRDASEHSDYHHLLAEYLAKRLPENAHGCDAGCGLGYLSLQLAPYCRQVTAVDVSPEALAVLAANCDKEKIKNVDIRCGEIAELPPDEPCEFYSLAEALQSDGRETAGIPQWIPEDYSLYSVEVRHGDELSRYMALYRSDRGELLIRVTYY